MWVRPNLAMKIRCAYLETVALTVAALALSVIAALSLQLELLNAIYPSKMLGARPEILQQMMTIYGAGFLFAAIASFIMIRYHRFMLSEFCFNCIRAFSLEVGATSRWFLKAGKIRQEAVWLSLIIGLGAAVRSDARDRGLQQNGYRTHPRRRPRQRLAQSPRAHGF